MELQLFQACTDGDLSTLKDLIAVHGLNHVEVKESSGLTLLHVACKHEHLNIIYYLIKEQNCNPETTTPNGCTPLHLACKSGHLHIVRSLITKYKCNPHYTDNDGYTPLHAASESGNLDSVKYLITEIGCDPEVSDGVGNTPLHYASESGHLNIVQSLITDFHCDPHITNSRGSIPLHSAAGNGNLAIVKYLIRGLGCNPQIGDSDGLTPLHYACHYGHVEVAKFLIVEHNCNPEYPNLFGLTPLHYACLHGHLAIVKYLICELRCNSQIVDDYGQTPLHLASWNGHLDFVTFLISECNCNAQCFDNNGSTPLHCVCEFGHFEVAKYLITECKCSLEHGNINGYTPLHLAAGNGHLALLKYLIIEQSCNTQITEKNGQTPLHLASLGGHLDILAFLTSECNCDPQCCDNYGTTPLHCACEEGHLEVAKFLITKHFCNPGYINYVALTPLHCACLHGHLAVVKYLASELNCNLQVTDQYGNTPLHLASWKGYIDIVTFLMSECNCDPQWSENNGNTPLHHACENGHLQVTKYLITEHKCSPAQGNMEGSTPLNLAAFNGHLAVMKYLISELGCNPQISDNDGLTPLLSLACQNGHLEVAKYLISEHKCSPEHGNMNGITPLHLAVKYGHLAVVKYLIRECGCCPEIGENYGSTPLHTACQNGHLEVAKCLITEHKCSPEHGNMNGITPLHLAAINGHLTLVEYLICELGCNPQIDDNNGNTALHYACQNGHLEVAMYLIIEHKCSPEHSNTNGSTPLHLATINGHLTVVNYLIIELDCNPQIRDNNGYTPLHYACYHGHLEVAKYLITEHKCSPEHGNMNDTKPLLLAAIKGHLALVKYLICELGCNPQIGNDNGSTPLHYACQNGHLEVARYLITEHKCSPEHGNMNGLTPLHSAAISGHLTVVEYLISKLGCNPQIGNHKGSTPLHFACQNGHLEVAMYLVTEHKCHPEQCNVTGITPLHSAAINGHLVVVKYLIGDIGCNPQISDNNGSTPLHWACKNGHLEVTKHLVSECGCDPMCLDQEGSTPLHSACTKGQLEIVKYLVTQRKCDPMHSTDNGYTPLHSACAMGSLEVVKYLVTECKCNPNKNAEVKVLEHSIECALDRIPRSLDSQWYPLSFSGMVRSILSNIGVKVVTPLHVASSKGHLNIVKYLITECGCNPNSCDNIGGTPLGYALHGKHFEIIQYFMTECKCNTACYPKLRNDGLKQLLQCGESDLPDCFKLPDFSITPLQEASFRGDFETVKFLCHCTRHTKSLGVTPLEADIAFEAACFSGNVDIMKYLIKNLIPQCHLSQLLLLACVYGHLDIVKFLFDECGFDSQCTEVDGFTSLHATCTDIKYLYMKAYNRHLESKTDSSVTNIKEQGILSNIWQAIIVLISQFVNRLSTASVSGVSNPDASHTLRMECDSTSQLELKSHKFGIFKYLVAEKKCKVQCKDKDGQTPLHYACASGQLDIVQYLHREKLSDLNDTTLSGDTPLHMACKYSQEGITEFLLSTGECDPLCKNAEEITPLEIATSENVRELLDHFCKGNYPIESVVKVFILGDPLAGKSSLVQALQSNSGFISSLIGRFQRIKGVRQQTAGIDSMTFSSNDFGNVVIFDFAGQREFLTSHAAFLQTSTSQFAGIFIVVTDITKCENDVCQSLQYWVSFIVDCSAHNKMKPQIIFVGSHEDQLLSGDIDQMYSLLEKMVFSEHDSNQFYKPKGIVCLDCTRPASSGLDLLCYHLEQSCNSIREHAEKIDQRCYVLHRYVQKMYIGAGVQGCTLQNISKDLGGNSYLLPSNPTELLPLFQTLHDKGQVLLLRNNQNLGKSWVITDIAAVLENVIGSIFAPKDFSMHISLGSTGVFAKSRITEVFSGSNTDMIIGFLEHFEFCHRVKPGWFDLPGLEQSHAEMTDDEYYLFPALVTSDHPSHERYGSSYCCGWLIHSVQDQFFTARFLHVLLLRLAFLFSQPQDDTTLSNTKTEVPAMRRRCKIWKNGLAWQDANGVSAVFEVRDLETVILSMTCMDNSRIHCVRLRSQLIQTILKSKREFCERVLTEEFIVEVADDILRQVKDENSSYSIKYLSSRISTRSGKDNPDLTLINQDGTQGKRISELLYFEPYALLTPDLIAKLFTKENAKQPLSSVFITELAKSMYPFCDVLHQVLEPSPRLLNKKCKNVCDSLGELAKQQLICEHIIETWVEQQERPATYRNLRRQLDRYSIFCGRNPLKMVDESGPESGDESDSDDSIPQINFKVDENGDKSGDDTIDSVTRNTLTDQDLFALLKVLEPATPNWKRVGLALGFLCDQLTIIERKPMLIPEGDTGYIRDMLNQWLKWAPPNHEWPTLTALATALQKCQQESLAANLRVKFMQQKDAAGSDDQQLERHSNICGTNPLNQIDEIADISGDDSDRYRKGNALQGEFRIDRPTLVECVRFRGRERRINICQEIGTKCITFGTLLLQDRTGERVNAITHKPMSDSEQTSMEILEEWIAGRGKQPVTWNTLIEVLCDIELHTLAREIKAVKYPEGDKDKHTEVVEGTNQRTVDNICAENSDQGDDGEIPAGSIEDFRYENSEQVVSGTEANLSTNTNPEMCLNIGDTNDSEVLEQEQKNQTNGTSNGIGWTEKEPNQI